MIKLLGIIICEDNDFHKVKIENIIKNEIKNSKLDLKIELSANGPAEVIKFLKSNLNKNFIYFLDVELESDINGIELGKIIRKYDSIGYIVFVTSHTDLAYLTFKYKIQALDYISKFDTSTFKESISECLLEAYNDYKNIGIKEPNTIKIDVGNRIIKFNYDEILFFETINIDHRLRLHTKTGQFEFYGKMKDLGNRLPPYFNKTHRSYLINTNNIKSINKKTNIISMINGEICYASVKYLKGLKKNV